MTPAPALGLPLVIIKEIGQFSPVVDGKRPSALASGWLYSAVRLFSLNRLRFKEIMQ